MKKLLLILLIPLLLFSCSPEDSGIGVSLNKTSLTLVIGKTEKLTATVTPANVENNTVKWSTSNTSIATVSGAGTVTAVAEGTATITATSRADAGKKANCTVTVNPRPITDIGAKDGLSGLKVDEYFIRKNVFIGWNLGNAFDAGTYGSWTRKIDKDFLSKVKEAGFSMVRIPVTWRNYVGDAPNYTINQSVFTELIQVVDWAYDAGLVTVINIHHDGSQNGPTFSDTGNNATSWLSILRLKQNQTQRDAATAKFIKVWEQIADKFKDYGDWLIFEPFNELHNGGWGWGTIDNEEYEIINDLNQKFTNTVRAAGGKNTERFLVVQPYCAKPHQALASTFILPTDTATGKQIVSMHYYDPEPFALRGTNINWGTESDKISLSNAFNSYADKFTKNNIPIILGECGATYQNRTDTAQNLTAAGCRLAYMEYMCSEAKKYGIIPVYWDNGTTSAGGDSNPGENFGLWDRRPQGDLNVIHGMKDVIDTMINAVQ